MAESELQLP